MMVGPFSSVSWESPGASIQSPTTCSCCSDRTMSKSRLASSKQLNIIAIAGMRLSRVLSIQSLDSCGTHSHVHVEVSSPRFHSLAQFKGNAPPAGSPDHSGRLPANLE